MVLQIWGDGVGGPRCEKRTVGVRHECEHEGIYIIKPPGLRRAQKFDVQVMF